MRVVSVNVGLPREVDYRGNRFATGIYKAPVEGRIAVRRLNLDGDRQADLTVHGGPDKAVYAYPIEHYPAWRGLLGADDLPPGAFGENLTVEGLTEGELSIGDRLRIGSAEFVVTQPRSPCYKLAAKFDRQKIVREMLESGMSGFYLSVAVEGELGAGDPVEIVSQDRHAVRVAELNALLLGKWQDRALMERAVRVNGLAAVWREMMAERLLG
ncbi:MAG TPA: MOSC domain-containing protein [Chthonomonadaceae bacterium]|nr:MOSC domain-containing protein [Chthonomonadaceae bacterium]